VCACVCVRVCVRACVRVCVRVGAVAKAILRCGGEVVKRECRQGNSFH